MASYSPVIKNGSNGAIFYLGLPSLTVSGAFQTNPTLALGDVKVSKDGAALANITTLPVVTPAGGKMVKVTLSQSEVNADNVTVVFSDASGDEWGDVIVNIPTTAFQFDDIPTAVWDVTTRVLTAGTNIALAKGLGVTGFNDISASQVNAEMLDVLVTDTYPEPAQGAPAATTSLSAKINYLFKAWRNKHTQTASRYALYDDTGLNVDQKAAVADDGTTFSRAEIASGP